ncbi:hypothetical protein Hanom_Chr12g01118991 [Helianthus anomalus]
MLRQHMAWSTLRFAESETVQQVQWPWAVLLTHGAVLVQGLTLQLMKRRETEGHMAVLGGRGAMLVV